jgi:ABC-type antimicrobial peptide transport system permease subunit
VSGGLGTVALLLALLGIYGVTAFSVSQRTREIGVRVALGAQRSHVLGLVLRQGVVLAVVGVVVGSLAAFGATRLIANLLYGVPPTDVIAFSGAAVALGLAAVVASWIPARRAARVDPIIALRSE